MVVGCCTLIVGLWSLVVCGFCGAGFRLLTFELIVCVVVGGWQAALDSDFAGIHELADIMTRLLTLTELVKW